MPRIVPGEGRRARRRIEVTVPRIGDIRQYPYPATRVTVTIAVAGALAGCGDDNNDGGSESSRGKALFIERCGSCHTMRDAGTAGEGLDLDYDLREVDAARVLRSIEDAPTGMPENLAEGADAQAVAEYVAENRTPRSP
jgi:mono/diheme cytochrome c family protein